ncbi:MAG TPA: hypothetical protein VGC18_12790 [Lacisediminihabitans sp.]|uniref:TIR domain-containing protein n=1 Tax=Lacisediminihabitans sp. TaxID=2787631 RepID=UPI002ED7CA36
MSFDYDNDARLKDLLIGQAKNPGSPFEVQDWSVKTARPGWRTDAKNRIARSSQVVVLCGRHMGTASGVNVEIELAREAGKPYFLLAGYDNSTRPTAAAGDKLYKWTWENLKILIAGGR